MNLLLERSEQVAWHTDMAAVLRAMGVDPTLFDWFVSDVETNVPVPLFGRGDAWIAGDELAAVLIQPIQFIWAVFCAFPIGVRVAIERAPFADCNPAFWRAPGPAPQLPGACFEVVCWDSSATILVGVSEEQAFAFSRTYSDAKPLSSSWIVPGR